ncbi:MAG: helix-turn-helix transcriptional regulator [Waterburya sp.]
MIQNTLDALLSQRDITVPKLSRLSGIKEVTLYNLVNNPNVSPTSDTLDKLCRVFEVTVGTLILHITLMDEDEFRTLTPETQNYSYWCYRGYWVGKKLDECKNIQALNDYDLPIVNLDIVNWECGCSPVYEPELTYFQNVDERLLQGIKAEWVVGA